MPSKKNYSMSYEPERKDRKYQEPEFCVWRDKEGNEVFRIKYRVILEFSTVWGANHEIQESIIFWTKMLHNPD